MKPVKKSELLSALLNESTHLKSHLNLMLWLQGSAFQQLIKHEAMIAVWGDFSLGILYIDIVSTLPGVRSGKVLNNELNKLMQELYTYWHNHGKVALGLSVDKGIFHSHELECIKADFNLKGMHTAMIDGIKDLRGGHDCLYVFLSNEMKPSQSFKRFLPLVIPFIDSALRQIEHLPEQMPEAVIVATEEEMEANGTLSIREKEIMQWVKVGKTNPEIGMILDISPFTVKNHMQRIFKKLDVLNRAQSVTQYNKMYLTR